MQSTRRETLRWTALTLAARLWAKAEQESHTHAAAKTESATKPALRFLTPRESATIQRFAAVLIPSTERSQGATGAAGAAIAPYIDFVLSGAAPSLQRTWRRGLAEWEKAKDTDGTLAALAPQEFAPKSQQDQFFVLFKSAVTAAFYTSEEGITKELGYQGMGFLREFAGWQGETFAAPADYKPMLRSRS
jgi:hypothetical protein